MEVLKKICTSLFLIIVILAGCNFSTSKLSFSDIENVPNNVETNIDTNLKLQLVHDGENGSYIIFRSRGVINANVEQQEQKVTVELDVSNLQEEVEQQKIYYLSTEPKYEEIIVFVNGELTPFEKVTGL